MTIVKLKKITLYGCLDEKISALDELQSLGCLHITPLVELDNLLDKKDADTSAVTKEAWRHLYNCSHKLKPIVKPSSFDPVAIQQQIIHNKHQLEQLQAETDELKHKINALDPWGSFLMPDSQTIAGQHFWFYIVPHHEVKTIPWSTICGTRVHRDNQFSYVVVVAENEPIGMPGMLVQLPNESRDSLKERLEQVEYELENVQLERVKLTRWLPVFEKNLYRLEDQAALKQALKQTYDEQSVFALQGWIPLQALSKVKAYAAAKVLALKIEDPSPDELPPTLLDNKASLQGGEDLLSFYMTPSYWLWDPSTTIFFSFAVFFAMIFSDAGYAIILGAIVAFFWKRLGTTLTGKRFRNILIALVIFSLLWGVLVGSYFGLKLPPDSYLRSLKIFDIDNYSAMMMLSVLVGVIHIIIANLAQAWSQRHSPVAIANLGWATALISAVTAFAGFQYPQIVPWAKIAGFIGIAIGLIAIILFTSIEKPFWKRLLKGFIGLTRITGMFGDVLSYLRLFALGLASASLAAVFNDLAKHVYQSMPGFNVLFALLILVIGHGINFILSLMSGFIHGLRLNFIEFFNWGLPDEGTPFKAFSKKEISPWNR